MAYVRVPAGGAVNSDEATLRRDNQAGVAAVSTGEAERRQYPLLSEAEYAAETAAVREFNRTYVRPRGAGPPSLLKALQADVDGLTDALRAAANALGDAPPDLAKAKASLMRAAAGTASIAATLGRT